MEIDDVSLKKQDMDIPILFRVFNIAQNFIYLKHFSKTIKSNEIIQAYLIQQNTTKHEEKQINIMIMVDGYKKCSLRPREKSSVV